MHALEVALSHLLHLGQLVDISFLSLRLLAKTFTLTFTRSLLHLLPRKYGQELTEYSVFAPQHRDAIEMLSRECPDSVRK